MIQLHYAYRIVRVELADRINDELVYTLIHFIVNSNQYILFASVLGIFIWC